MVDRDAGKRVIGEPRFPRVGMVETEIGRDGINPVRQGGSVEPDHLDPSHVIEQADAPAFDNAEHQLRLALGHCVNEEEPHDRQHEGHDQQRTRIFDAQQQDDSQGQSEGGEETGQNAAAFTRAGQAGDRVVEPETQNQRPERGDGGMIGFGPLPRCRQRPGLDEPGKRHADQAGQHKLHKWMQPGAASLETPVSDRHANPASVPGHALRTVCARCHGPIVPKRARSQLVRATPDHSAARLDLRPVCP
ncbi:hypothetical protein OKA06_03735 [Novosphingobium sp. MW5]|nr:hypothetical protein [Novosphingobium sp. MW5]